MLLKYNGYRGIMQGEISISEIYENGKRPEKYRANHFFLSVALTRISSLICQMLNGGSNSLEQARNGEHTE